MPYYLDENLSSSYTLLLELKWLYFLWQDNNGVHDELSHTISKTFFSKPLLFLQIK